MLQRVSLAVLLLLAGAIAAHAGQQTATITGIVFDPLGARVPGAAVTLLRGSEQVAETTTGPDGTYRFANLSSDRYQVMARATGFDAQTSDPAFAGPEGTASVDLTLQVGPLEQGVVVTASAIATPQSQTGAPVTVIDQQTLDALNKPDVLESLRLVPGAQTHQTGARGGTTSFFIRGGNSNFAKVLIDGIPANDIGGGFDFSQIATTGVSKVEVLRQANSVIYGSDALTGVVNIETKRGTTRVPELTYSIDGGNLGTFRNALSVGGAVRRFDYFSEYSYFNTDNSVPNNGYTNKTYAGRFGVQLARNTDVSGVIRHVNGDFGSPNGITMYGIPDDSAQQSGQTFGGVTARSQWSDRFQTLVRYGETRQRSEYVNPTATGIPFDPFGFGANYLGERVTLTGANGYSVTGQGILDFGGVYPSLFVSKMQRRTLYGQASYTIAGDVAISAGGRVEREQAFGNPDDEDEATTTRNNKSVFVEGHGSIGGRTYVSAGVGVEDNEAFETVATPRVSVATYLRNPSQGAFGDTKVSFNAGKGIKAPAVFQVESSLFGLLDGVSGAPAVDPIAPEKGTSIDIGVEQGLWDGQARVRLAWFHNSYENLIEFVSRTVLPQVGVPVAVAQATAFGAYVNSQSYDAQGIEASAEALIGNRLRLMASYTFLDAEVTESFSSGALSPATNPSIPGVQIGAFSPLVGERPFRRPTHSGTFLISYEDGPAQITLASFFSGVRDDSTFMSDQFFGNSMLLPNQGLDAAYQKFDLSASYRVHRSVRPYVSIENLFDKQYEAAFGFPSLPRTARFGLSLTVGGN